MSQENVEVVRRALEAWQRDDLDAWLSRLDPAVEWYPALEGLVEGVGSAYRGMEGMRELWTAYRNGLADFRVELQGLRDVGDDRVVLLVHFWWRGPASGIELDSPAGLVMTVRGGKVIRSMDYLTHEEALKAAGLEE
jgi:ketosteroid isomerase-like protein